MATYRCPISVRCLNVAEFRDALGAGHRLLINTLKEKVAVLMKTQSYFRRHVNLISNRWLMQSDCLGHFAGVAEWEPVERSISKLINQTEAISLFRSGKHGCMRVDGVKMVIAAA